MTNRLKRDATADRTTGGCLDLIMGNRQIRFRRAGGNIDEARIANAHQERAPARKFSGQLTQAAGLTKRVHKNKTMRGKLAKYSPFQQRAARTLYALVRQILALTATTTRENGDIAGNPSTTGGLTGEAKSAGYASNPAALKLRCSKIAASRPLTGRLCEVQRWYGGKRRLRPGNDFQLRLEFAVPCAGVPSICASSPADSKKLHSLSNVLQFSSGTLCCPPGQMPR